MLLGSLLAVVCSAITFDAPRVYAQPGTSYTQPVIADFDGDGRNDVGVGSWSGPFTIRYGEPGGGLSAPETVPNAVFGAGDVLGDALPDLFSSDGILENLGGRRFATSGGTFGLGRYYARDFTGDGRNDLVVASQKNLTLLERMPNGRLEAFPMQNMGEYTTSAASGDVDGDRREEVIGIATTSVRVFRYAGGGKFEVAATYSVPEKPALVETADLDGDGREDILVYTETVEVVVFYGDGETARFAIGTAYSGGGDRLRIADFNGDGAPDVMIGHRGGAQDWLSFHFNDGNGAFRQTTQVNVDSIYEIGAGDVTGDGKADLVMPTVLGMTVVPGLGNGHFYAPRLLSLPPGSRHITADFNGDGLDEIVFYGNSRLSVAWGGGTVERLDHFYPSSAIQVRLAPNEIVTQSGYTVVAFARRDGAWHKRTLELSSFGIVQAADFDGDAKNELVSLESTSGAGYDLRVRSGDDGRILFSTFLPSPTLHDNFDFVLDDFTGDGRPDLALALSGTPQYPQVGGIPLRNGSISIFAGAANGSLTRISTPLTDHSPRQLTPGDFNGDGARDLAFTTYDNDAHVMYAQAGNFTAAQAIAPRYSYVRLAAHDVDGNGITDLLAASSDSFFLALGTREGLRESGRWYPGYTAGTPRFARLAPNAAPSLLLSTTSGAYVVDTNCVQSRRRSVRH